KAILGKSDQVANLKPIVEALFEAAMAEAHGRREEFIAGRGTLDIDLHASLRVLEAERLLSNDKAIQLGALEHHLNRMKEVEKINQARFDAGRIQRHDLAQSRFYRIQAELWLEQAKAFRAQGKL